MSLTTRLFLLAGGKRTDDPYARGVACAVRRYLCILFAQALFGVIGYALVGRLLFGSWWGIVPIALLAPCGYLLMLVPHLADQRFADRPPVRKEFTRPAWRLGGVDGIPLIRVFVTYEGETNAFAHGGARPRVIVHGELARGMHHAVLGGVIMHEVGHIVLPCGGLAFACVTAAVTPAVDAALFFVRLCKTFRIARVIASALLPFSSSHLSHQREHAADAIAVFVLRDLTSVQIALELLRSRTGREGGTGVTHPSTVERIRVLSRYFKPSQ